MKLFSKLELSRSWKSLWLYIRLLDVKIFFDNFVVLILPRPNYFLTHPIKMRNFNCIDHFGEKEGEQKYTLLNAVFRHIWIVIRHYMSQNKFKIEFFEVWQLWAISGPECPKVPAVPKNVQKCSKWPESAQSWLPFCLGEKWLRGSFDRVLVAQNRQKKSISPKKFLKLSLPKFWKICFFWQRNFHFTFLGIYIVKSAI